VVHTNDREAVEGRAGVFEFLLINHPLDCPVCDKGGECPLQDFSYKFGNTESRMDFPRRTFDGEGVKADVDFGPTLMLNRNRCIMCTRCERFMREVDGDAQIGVINRGNGSEIATFNDEGIHSLLSGNLMDVCPVGAITTKQYRFRSRPWDNPHAVDTICTGCSKGCSTTGWLKAKPEWAKGARLIRMTPRYNPQVNDYWMCDIGRFTFGWVEGDTRLRRPEVRTRDGALQHVTWKDALARVRDVMAAAARAGQGAVQFLTSAHASVEELFLLKRLAAETPGAGSLHVTYTRSEKVQPATTRFHIPATDAPNLNGAADLGLRIGAGLSGDADLSALKAAVDAGSVSLVYIVDLGPDGSMGDMQWLIDARTAGRVGTLVYEGVVTTALAGVADIILPGSAWVEKDATYTNDQGHVQASSKAITPPGEAVDDWQILTSVGAALGLDFTYTSSQQVRAAVAASLASLPAYASLADTTFNRPVTAEHWLQSSNPMERMKWQDLFQDLPPVKGHNVQMENQPPATVIPLRLVTEEVARASE